MTFDTNDAAVFEPLALALGNQYRAGMGEPPLAALFEFTFEDQQHFSAQAIAALAKINSLQKAATDV